MVDGLGPGVLDELVLGPGGLHHDGLIPGGGDEHLLVPGLLHDAPLLGGLAGLGLRGCGLRLHGGDLDLVGLRVLLLGGEQLLRGLALGLGEVGGHGLDGLRVRGVHGEQREGDLGGRGLPVDHLEHLGRGRRPRADAVGLGRDGGDGDGVHAVGQRERERLAGGELALIGGLSLLVDDRVAEGGQLLGPTVGLGRDGDLGLAPHRGLDGRRGVLDGLGGLAVGEGAGHPGAADPEDRHEREAGGDGERLAGALRNLIGLDLIALGRVERGVLRSLIHGGVQDGGLAERAHGLIGAVVDGVGVGGGVVLCHGVEVLLIEIAHSRLSFVMVLI